MDFPEATWRPQQNRRCLKGFSPYFCRVVRSPADIALKQLPVASMENIGKHCRVVDTVDGRNPAPVGSWFIWLEFDYLQCFIVTLTSYQLVFRISEPSTVLTGNTHGVHHLSPSKKPLESLEKPWEIPSSRPVHRRHRGHGHATLPSLRKADP